MKPGRRRGYISLGDSSETAAFITDNLVWWWTQYGIHRYVVFTDYETIKERIESTTTSTGLRVTVRLNLGEYEKGVKVDKAISQHKRIRYNPTLPALSYKISPG